MITNQDLINLGFYPVPNFNIGNGVIYDLGRNTHLSASSIGTPNEMVYIYLSDEKDYRIITDIINLHNYDYDGYLTEEKVKLFMLLKKKER